MLLFQITVMSKNPDAVMNADATIDVQLHIWKVIVRWEVFLVLTLFDVIFGCSDASGQNTVKVTSLYLYTNCTSIFLFFFFGHIKASPQILTVWKLPAKTENSLKPGSWLWLLVLGQVAFVSMRMNSSEQHLLFLFWKEGLWSVGVFCILFCGSCGTITGAYTPAL